MSAAYVRSVICKCPHQSQGLFILIVCFSSVSYLAKVALTIMWGDSTTNL